MLCLVAVCATLLACRRHQAEPPARPAVSAPVPASQAIPAAPASPPVAAPAGPAAPVLPAPPPGSAIAQPAGAGVPVPAAQVAPQDQTVGTLVITSSTPVLYRWGDGDWIFRATFSVRNTGPAPVDIDRASFRLADWTPWGNEESSLPVHATINPGLTVAGDIAWYLSGSQPQPTSATVAYAPGENENPTALASRTFQPVFSPAPTAAGTAPTRVVFSLPVTVTTPGLTFVHSDGNRAVRFTVSVTNTTGAPLRIPLDYFQAKIGDRGGSRWGDLITLAEPIELAAGATATGTIGYYWGGDASGAPATIAFSFGPPNSPQFNASAAVAEGPSPIQ